MFSSGPTVYSKVLSTLHALPCSAREIRLELVQRVSECTVCSKRKYYISYCFKTNKNLFTCVNYQSMFSSALELYTSKGFYKGTVCSINALATFATK